MILLGNWLCLFGSYIYKCDFIGKLALLVQVVYIYKCDFIGNFALFVWVVYISVILLQNWLFVLFGSCI